MSEEAVQRLMGLHDAAVAAGAGSLHARSRLESALREALMPAGWRLVPEIGARVKANHPITCLNPTEYFEVTELRADSDGRIAVRGEDTCWFSLSALVLPSAAAPEVPADARDAARWVAMSDGAPPPDTDCAVLLSYTPGHRFIATDRWEVHHEDLTGMGGPTMEMGYAWRDNYESDVLGWLALPKPPDIEDPRDDAAMAAPTTQEPT